MEKQQRYLEISKQIAEQIGGIENVRGVSHCATRLRIVLRDDRQVRIEDLEQVELVKGAFLAGDQLQLIFGAGLVDEVCDVFSEYSGWKDAGPVQQKTERKYNPLQTAIKALSDIFIGIMPGILAGALLMGVTGILENTQIAQANETLYALNRLGSIAADGIFGFLPMAVCYSAVKQFGGNPLLGMVMGAIMLDPSLADAYAVGAGTVQPEVISIFGWDMPLVGFQGGIIIALMIGFLAARLDVFFQKKIPIVLKRLLAPVLTVFVSTLLLFMFIGPVGRMLSQSITNNMLWMAENLGMFGYAFFAGVQQIIVVTGLHHIISAVEAQLIADTGRNFIHPLMSVALMGQGGAVLGYLALNWKKPKAREICIPSFISVLFGVSEPAIFGVNLRYRYPLICGCIGGAIAGSYVYSTGLTSLGFGTTSLPGLSLADPVNDGYAKYLIAHAIAASVAFLATIAYAKLEKEKKELEAAASAASGVVVEHQERGKAFLHSSMNKDAETFFGEMQESELTQDLEEMLLMDGAQAGEPDELPEQSDSDKIEIISPARGLVKNISESSDATFASKILGDGILIEEHDGKVYAPCDAQVLFVFDGGHAVGLMMEDRTGILLHCGVGTVNLEGEGFRSYVQRGDLVKKGDLLLLFDKEFVEAKGYSSEIMMLFTEFGENRKLTLCYEGWAGRSEVIGKVYQEDEV